MFIYLRRRLIFSEIVSKHCLHLLCFRGDGTDCYDICDRCTNILCILANVCLLSNSLCACLSTYLSIGLRVALQKTLVKQSSLDNDPFESSNGEDNIFNDVDGNARQSSDEDTPPTPPRPATPTVVHQKTLPWKPKVRYRGSLLVKILSLHVLVFEKCKII